MLYYFAAEFRTLEGLLCLRMDESRMEKERGAPIRRKSADSEKEQVRGWSDTWLEMTSHQAAESAEQGFAKDQQIK